MTSAQYTRLASRLAKIHDELLSLEQCVKPMKKPCLMHDAIAMQGIVARMARNNWAMMDESMQCQAALNVAHIKATAVNL